MNEFIAPMDRQLHFPPMGGGVGHRTGLYLVGDVVRRLHIDEAKQVMGFRKQHYVSSGIAGYRQLGNAVIPGMVSKIYDSVRIT